MNRLKDYMLWVAIIAYIPVLCEAFGWHILPSNYKEVATGLLSIFVLLGFVNNPDKNKAVDTTEKQE